MCRYLLGGLRACLGLLLAGAALAELPEPVAARLQAAKLPESALSALVMPLDGGPARLRHQAELPVNPASTIKLLTTLAALETLGPTFAWRTGFYTDGVQQGDTLHGHLYLKGGGDPRLTYERVWQLLRELRNLGLRRIDGDLVLDRSYFQLPASEDGDFDEQPERAYNVAPDALLMNFKALRFDMESDAHGVQVRVEPALAGIRAGSVQRVRAGDCASWSRGWARPQISSLSDGGLDVQLQGSFPPDCRASRYLGVLSAPDFASQLTRSLWAELGGEIVGSTREASVPPEARLLAEQLSAPLAEQIRDVNKLSNNTMARAILLTLGAERPQAGLDSQAAGQAAVHAWLASQALHFPELVLENGAGLSRSARISAEHLGQLLLAGQRSAFAPEFLASLPIVGLDGTMRRRLNNSEVAGRARIKTGTLNDVKAIAGYLRDSAGRDWIVVGLLNHPRAEAGQAALDALLEWAALPANPNPETAAP